MCLHTHTTSLPVEHLQKFSSQLVYLAYVTVNNKADIQGCPLTSSHVCSDTYANIYTGASIHTHIKPSHTFTRQTHT